MTATTLHDVALITAARGDRGAAEALFRQAMDIHRKALGRKPPARRRDAQQPVAGSARPGPIRRGGGRARGRAGHRAPGARERPSTDRDLHDQSRLRAPGAKGARGRRGAAPGRLADPDSCRLRLVPNRRRIFPEDDWSVGATKSLLGATLTALTRYSEAETVLLEARRDLDGTSSPPRRDVDATNTRLVDLYVAWGKPDQAARYRARPASSR